jgi:hypothetical protein
MRQFIRTRMNPDWFHGHNTIGPFFEGWYFKVINAAEDKRYAFIPGTFINPDKKKNHSFIQVLNGMEGTAIYHRYPADAFHAAKDSFDVRVRESHFRRDCMRLAIDGEQGRVQGELHFDGLTPWPVTMTSPGIMGWYGWLPFMECNHGVVSLDHAISGILEIDGERVDFTGGRGYIEKDWGTNFPSGYIWQQTNHFDTIGTSLTASIATIPLGPLKFPGAIIGFWHDNTLYRFAKYTGAKTERLHVTDTHVEWSVYDKKHHLEMISERAEGGLLMGPEQVDMQMHVRETMQATINVTLSTLENGHKRIIYSGTGRNAALEVVGDLGMLLTT